MSRKATIITNVLLYFILLIPIDLVYRWLFPEMIWQDKLYIFAFCPILLLCLVVWTRPGKATALKFSSIDNLKSIPPSWRIHLFYRLPVLKILALSLIVFAIARPQTGNRNTKVSTKGIAIMSVIDVSGSMKALDFATKTKRQNRLDVVKDVFHEFVAGGPNMKGRKNDLVGIVAFAGFPDSKCPLTLDHDALLNVLKSQVQIIKDKKDANGNVINGEESTTAIGDALVIGVERLKNYPGKSKIIILLTDGENTAGVTEPLDAVLLAKEARIKIYTIGVGTNKPVPFPFERGGEIVLEAVQMNMDENLLRQIAQETKGKYYNAQDISSLKNIYNEIDTLERETIQVTYLEYEELYLFFVIPALFLLLLEKLLQSTILRKIP